MRPSAGRISRTRSCCCPARMQPARRSYSVNRYGPPAIVHDLPITLFTTLNRRAPSWPRVPGSSVAILGQTHESPHAAQGDRRAVCRAAGGAGGWRGRADGHRAGRVCGGGCDDARRDRRSRSAIDTYERRSAARGSRVRRVVHQLPPGRRHGPRLRRVHAAWAVGPSPIARYPAQFAALDMPRPNSAARRRSRRCRSPRGARSSRHS